MKKLLTTLFALIMLSGCSLSLGENPDQENFDKGYENPDLSKAEQDLIDGNISKE